MKYECNTCTCMYNVDNCAFQCSKMCMWWSTLALGFWWPSLRDTGTPQSALTSSSRPSARNGPSSSGPPSPETGESASWSESFKWVRVGWVVVNSVRDHRIRIRSAMFSLSGLVCCITSCERFAHKCQRNVATFRPMLGDYGLWAEGELYRATHVVTRETLLFHDHPDLLIFHDKLWVLETFLALIPKGIQSHL